MGAVLFSFTGRIGRAVFLLSSAGLFLLLLVYQYLTGGWVLNYLGWAIWGYVQGALLVKRLHDVNRSGFWALAVGAALVIGGIVFSFIGGAEGTPSALRLVGFSVPMACAMGFTLGLLAFVGSKPGSSRDNRFGEPPEYPAES